MKNRYKPMFATKRRHYARNITIILVLLIVLFAGYITVTDVFAYGRQQKGAVSVYFPENANYGDVAKILNENGAVNFPVVFRFYSLFKGDEIVTGAHAVECSLSYKELLDAISAKNNINTISFLVEEGSTVADIEDMALSIMNITKAQFEEAMANYKWSKNYCDNAPRPTKYQGYLYPDKYNFTKGTDANVLVSTLVSKFDQMVGERLEKASADSGMAVNDIVIIASIVEKECNTYDEMIKKAGEIKKNLKEEKPIASEAALKYALGKNELLDADKKISSPYNTFINKGLPRGPICNPSTEAIKAVTEAK